MGMRREYLIILLMIILALGVSARSYADEKKEKYIPKVIIDKQWGRGYGEFSAIIEKDEGLTPNYFCIDSEGNIYIVNSIIEPKILKFSENGEFLFEFNKGKYYIEVSGFDIDKYNKIYLLTQSEYKSYKAIFKFNSKGRLLKRIGNKEKNIRRYSLSEQKKEYNPEIIAEDGKFSNYIKGLSIVNKHIYVLDKAHDKKYMKFNLKGNFIGNESNKIIEDNEKNTYKIIDKRIKKIDRKNSLIKEVNISAIDKKTAMIENLGIDKEGNLYIWQRIILDGTYKSGKYVFKFNKNLELTDSIEIYPEKSLIGMEDGDKVRIDKSGYIYQLQQYKTGIKLIKWENT
jgi:hypothetical protein